MKPLLLSATLLSTISLSAQDPSWNPNHRDKKPSPEQMQAVQKALPKEAIAEPQAARKLLIYSATAGYRHRCIPIAQVALEGLGKSTGAYEAVVSDDLSNFEKDALSEFDAVLMLNSTGDIFMPNSKKERKKFSDDEWTALLARHERLIENLVTYVEEGGGLAGIHAATDACKGNHEYTETIGGAFDSHPWTSNSEVTVVVTEPEHAIIKPVFEGIDDFRIKDEIYQFAKGTASPKKLRILLNLDPERSDKPKQKPKRDRNDLPICWVQKVGKGRVFYSSLGHNNDLYWNPLILKHYLAGLQFALGDIEAETSPSKTVTLPKVIE